jgi:hypothetical protein
MNATKSLGVTFTYCNFGGKMCWATLINNTEYVDHAPTLNIAVSSVRDSVYHMVLEDGKMDIVVPSYKISAEEELDLIRYKCC